MTEVEAERADRALQRAIADACLALDAGGAIGPASAGADPGAGAVDLRAFLEARGVAPEDIEAILAAPPRLGVYRSLVRNALSVVVARMLPRTRARLNAACPGRFDADFAAFVDAVGPRTHYLRDVPGELLAWAEPRWRGDPVVPAWIADLARYELTEFDVAAAPPAEAAAPGAAAADLALERPLRMTPSLRVLHAAWAVHELPVGAGSGASGDAGRDAALPTEREVHLLAYRDEAHDVCWLEVPALDAAVVERLGRGEALGEAVRGACAEQGVEPAAVLAEVARVLAELADRGVVLGTGP